ncbi:unnamed protein product [Fusarium graminearum]|uniref:Chromosome 2, complete genome n=1 Tax=Gibberella zeae (strain ATCC MYA-4620 / CBS 123657 / FGSC 9075 / NRRL 31084 / PH-1) TaxID=229533 RepID=A0A098DI26_GIBZE|nr:unnamed protein product [Fusarium graminearum]
MSSCLAHLFCQTDLFCSRTLNRSLQTSPELYVVSRLKTSRIFASW